jgi:hypothetical protein
MKSPFLKIKLFNFSIFTVLAIIILSLTNCSKSTSPAPANQFGGDKGQITFWAINSDLRNYPITITVNGIYVGTIGGPLTVEPDCINSNDKVVKFIAEPGTYNLYAKANLGGQWTGSFTVTSGDCSRQKLE